MLNRLDRIASETHGALHRDTIDDPAELLAIFRRGVRGQSILDAGIDRHNEPRRAVLVGANASELFLSPINVPIDRGQEYYFKLEIEGALYFFAGRPHSTDSRGHLRCPLPSAIYRAERRDLERAPVADAKVELKGFDGAGSEKPRLVDRSPFGAAIRVSEDKAQNLPSSFSVRIDGIETEMFAEVRHRTPDAKRPGWVTVGLSISSVARRNTIPIDRRERIVNRSQAARSIRAVADYGLHRARRRLGLARARNVEVVEFQNSDGNTIRGIVDAWGDSDEATAVVIPPAWGRTKETLMPLALTIVETFKRAGASVQVLRYDGTNRRGESHIDPECQKPGDEYLHFRFSRAAQDVASSVEFLRSRERSPKKTILVTFSLAAVEGRYAMANSATKADGWVSVVGVADLQSALRTISGGVDYGYGLLQGVRFGRHELVGVVADMDLTGIDAIEHRMGFLEDARRDMSRIVEPVTWIHGRHDAWMDLERVVDMLSCGRLDNRRLIEVPTGHQLRSSGVAMSTFQLIAEEVSEMALGMRLRGAAPSVSRISETRDAEKARLPARSPDIRSFWEDYLLGRDRTFGMELLTATAAYRNFFESQVRELGLRGNERVVDLGAGTGEFALGVSRSGLSDRLRVIEVDLVASALRRSSARRGPSPFAVQLVANLDLAGGTRVPLRDRSVDAVVASLLISYLTNARQVLREIYRVLRPGGRLVVSSLLEDADVSMLLHDGLIEFATPESRRKLGAPSGERFEGLVRSFLNDGSKLLEFEEEGTFRFWSEEDLRYAVVNAGFTHVTSSVGLGSPPQAVLVGATRP